MDFDGKLAKLITNKNADWAHPLSAHAIGKEREVLKEQVSEQRAIRKNGKEEVEWPAAAVMAVDRSHPRTARRPGASGRPGGEDMQVSPPRSVCAWCGDNGHLLSGCDKFQLWISGTERKPREDTRQGAVATERK